MLPGYVTSPIALIKFLAFSASASSSKSLYAASASVNVFSAPSGNNAFWSSFNALYAFLAASINAFDSGVNSTSPIALILSNASFAAIALSKSVLLDTNACWASDKSSYAVFAALILACASAALISPILAILSTTGFAASIFVKSSLLDTNAFAASFKSSNASLAASILFLHSSVASTGLIASIASATSFASSALNNLSLFVTNACWSDVKSSNASLASSINAWHSAVGSTAVISAIWSTTGFAASLSVNSL